MLHDSIACSKCVLVWMCAGQANKQPDKQNKQGNNGHTP